MKNLHVRIDDRLIHGQIIASWARTLNIGSIIAIDNELSKNEMLKNILLMGVPKEYNPRIVDQDEAIKLVKRDIEKSNIMLITRFAKNLKDLKNLVIEAKEVNIGNCSKQSDTIYISKGIGVGQVLSFSEEDVEVLDFLFDNGVNVIFQQMPSDKLVNWPALKKKLKKLK